MNRTITLIATLISFSTLPAQQPYDSGRYEEGIAVYYADDLHGQATSYGEIYRREGFTAAHQHHPPGAIVRVTRLDNGRSVEVRINDKMAPDHERKIILSRAAAMQIGLASAGTLRVRIERVDGGRPLPQAYAGREQPGGSGSNAMTARSPSRELYPRSGTSNQVESPAGSSPSGANVVLSSGRALAPGLTGYVIQLASYEDGANAVSNANQLLKQGLQHVYIWQKDGRNRVVIARFQDKASATEYLNTLRQQYLLDGIIVQLK
ncbi:MAG: septal ring lytic transglycosylase RlpA family protein [Phaeodactylibacter sp.]|nr:septal ring lytic transglycosylase RlpA family protein [Phaeodactylibacter sp.]